MEIIKYKNGSIGYKEKVYLPNGSRITKTFTRKTDAVNWKRKMEVLKQQGEFDLTPVNQKILFLDVAEQWLEKLIKANCSHKTYYDYKSHINKHFKKRFEKKTIAQLSTTDVYNMINEMKIDGLLPKTINKMICNLKQIYKYALKEKIILKNQMSEVSLLPVPERDFDYFDKSDIQNILDTAKGSQMHSIIVVALNTGLRIGEIFGLKWDKIDFANKTISVARKMTRQGIQDFTKSKRIRRIGINPQLDFELRKQRRNNPDSEFVFTQKGEPICPDHFTSRQFAQLLKDAGVRPLRFHDLRHTFASHFMMNGGNIYQLQHVLGHTETAMTMKYAHLSQDHLVQAATTVGFSAEDFSKTANSPCLALAENEVKKLSLVNE